MKKLFAIVFIGLISCMPLCYAAAENRPVQKVTVAKATVGQRPMKQNAKKKDDDSFLTSAITGKKILPHNKTTTAKIKKHALKEKERLYDEIKNHKEMDWDHFSASKLANYKPLAWGRIASELILYIGMSQKPPNKKDWQIIRTAKEHQPDKLESYMRFMFLAALDNKNKNGVEEALSVLKEGTIKLPKEEDKINLAKLMLLIQSKASENKIEQTFKRGIQNNKQSTFMTYVAMATYYAQTGGFRRGIKCLEDGINKSDKDLTRAMLYKSLGMLYLQAGNFQGAKDALAQATEKDDKVLKTNVYVAGMDVELGNYQQAINALNTQIATAEKHDITLPVLYTTRGDAYSRNKQADLATQDFTKAMQLNSTMSVVTATDVVIERKCAEHYLRIGDYKNANKYADDLLLIGKDPDALVIKARILESEGKYSQAEKYFDDAIKLSPTDYRSYYWRGKYFEHIGKTDKAVKDYKQALKVTDGLSMLAKKALETLELSVTK